MIEFFFFGFVPVTIVHRVGEPDAAAIIDGQIIGRTQFLAVEPVGDHGVFAVGIKAHDAATAGTAAVELAMIVEAQAVGAVGAFAPHADDVGFQVIAQDAVFADVGEEYFFARPHRALGDEFAFGLHDEFKIPRHVDSLG